MSSRAAVSPEADPAPLIAALLAGDVVAASILVSRDFATGARLHIVLPSISGELIITDVGAADPAVVDGATAHADFLAACADCPLAEAASASDIVHAADPGAPAHVWVQVHVDVHLKAHVLLEDVFRTELPDISLLELHPTVMLHAWNLDDLPVNNIVLKVLGEACFAENVITR